MSSQEEDRLREEDLEHLREWLSKLPHMPKVPDDMLALFLHSRDYNLKLTKHTIEAYYTMRTRNPKFFSKRDPLDPKIQETMAVMSYVVLPDRDVNGNAIIITSLMDEDSAKFVHAYALKLFMMYEDVYVQEYGIVPGFTVIVDSGNSKLGHLQRISLDIFRKHLAYFQDATPMKISEFHIVNVSSAAEKLFSLAKPFMAKQLVDKVIFHSSNLERLYKTVPKDILPEDYGGKQKPMKELKKLAEQKLVEMREMLMKEEDLRIDESKRTGNSKLSDFEKTTGSFKKLDID